MIRFNKLGLYLSFASLTAVSLSACFSSNQNQTSDGSSNSGSSFSGAFSLSGTNDVSIATATPTSPTNVNPSNAPVVQNELPSASIRVLFDGSYDAKTHQMISLPAQKGLFPSIPNFARYLNYTGDAKLSDSMNEKYRNEIIQWTLVKLRKEENGETVSSAAGVVLNTGRIADPNDLSSDIHFTNIEEGEYFAVIYSDTAIPAMTAHAIKVFRNPNNDRNLSKDALYDFSISDKQVYNLYEYDNVERKQEDGLFAFPVGDANNDCWVDTSDFPLFDNSQSSEFSYSALDLNKDGLVNQVDNGIFDRTNLSFAACSFSNAEFINLEDTQQPGAAPSVAVTSGNVSNPAPSSIIDNMLGFLGLSGANTQTPATQVPNAYASAPSSEVAPDGKITLVIHALLEGPLNTEKGTMSTLYSEKEILSLEQPFRKVIPIYYNGDEKTSYDFLHSINATTWGLVGLMPKSPELPLIMKAVIINQEGIWITVDGQKEITFEGLQPDMVYKPFIYAQGEMLTSSSSFLKANGEINTLDFVKDPSLYETNNYAKTAAGLALTAGDIVAIDENGNILDGCGLMGVNETSSYSAIENALARQEQFNPCTDLNLNGQTDKDDYRLVEQNVQRIPFSSDELLSRFNKKQ